MSIIHDVIKLIAGKITSTDVRCKHSSFKTKNSKIITDKDFHNKKSNTKISKVKLTVKKKEIK